MSLLAKLSLYRELQQHRESGASMAMHEILTMEALWLELRAPENSLWPDEMHAVLTTKSVEQVVSIEHLGPDTLVCTGCPGVLPSESFGLRIDDAREKQSYLFRVRVTRIQHGATDVDSHVHLAFVGRPVVLRWTRGRSSSPEAVLALESKLCAA